MDYNNYLWISVDGQRNWHGKDPTKSCVVLELKKMVMTLAEGTCKMLWGQCELGRGWRQRVYAMLKTRGHLCPTCRKTKWLKLSCSSPLLPSSSSFYARRNIDVIQGLYHDQWVDGLVEIPIVRADNIIQCFSVKASLPRSNANSLSAVPSKPKPRPVSPASNLLKDGITRHDDIPLWDISRL